MNTRTKLISALAVVSFLITVISISCRKADLPNAVVSSNEIASVESKFFSSHRSGGATENALANFLMRENAAKHFIEPTVKKIGYPRWDKIVKVTPGLGTLAKVKLNAVHTQGTTTQTPYDLYYVPFVRDSQNYVNASMVIKAGPTDTSFSYLCDWQYRNRPHGAVTSDSTAEDYALFFMLLDKTVFGHTKFQISDKSLFKNSNLQPVSIEFAVKPENSNAKLNSMAQTCVDIYVTYENCPYTGHCLGPGGTCDHCSQCLSSIMLSYCWDGDMAGGGGTGDSGGGSTGGGDTGGGGSGTYTGGSTPPDPCGGTPQTGSIPNVKTGTVTMLTAPCNPDSGWTPVITQQDADALANQLGRYWEDPAYDDVPFPAYDPNVDGPRDQDGYRKNGPSYSYTDGTVQNYTNDNGGKYAVFTGNNGAQVKFPGATITDFGVNSGAGVTTANGGIHLSTLYNGIEDMQHEYGHYLQAQQLGSVYYYGVIVPQSLASATFAKSQHRFFWTEKDANTRSAQYFGPDSPIAKSSYYPKN